jgi:hypothetical protein
MAVRIQKSAVNIREKLAELERPIGVNGQALMATDTPQEAFSLIGARNQNRIINGDMRLDQRNAGGAITSADAYSVDRWGIAYSSTNSTASVQRVTDAPVRFTNSLKYTVTSAASPLANSSSIRQVIEGFNISDLFWGTSNASPITLSFWVKSSLTGNFGGSITNGNFDRTYPFPYTINSSNTWEYKTVTIPGDTTGTWNTGNTAGIQVNFSLGAVSAREATANVWANTIARQPTGSVNLISTNGATWQITGVQLEAGTVATPFERRSYGQELALCQRYFCKSSNPEVVAINGAGYTTDGMFYSGTASLYSSANGYIQAIMFPVSMRTAPSTITFISTNLGGSSGQWSIYFPNVWTGGSMSVQSSTSTGFGAVCTGSWTAGVGLTYGAWTASVEL